MSRQIITTTRLDGTRSTYALQPGSTVPMQLEALKPLKPSRIKADRRTYPKYKPGMSTADYVAMYEASNGGHMTTAGFWQPLNRAPAAGYTGLDTVEHGEFDMLADDPAQVAAMEAPAEPAAAAPAPVAPEPVADVAPAVIPWQILAARPTATYCTPVRMIGKHEWVCVVYLHDTYGACTDYVWRRVSDSRAGGQYEGGRFFPGREWPTYDSNHASHGQPATLAKLYAAHETEIRAALAAGRPSPLQAWQAAAARAGVDPVATAADADSMADACLDRFGVADPLACVHQPAFADWHRAALAEIRGWAAPAAAPMPDPAEVARLAEIGRARPAMAAEIARRANALADTLPGRAAEYAAAAAALATDPPPAAPATSGHVARAATALEALTMARPADPARADAIRQGMRGDPAALAYMVPALQRIQARGSRINRATASEALADLQRAGMISGAPPAGSAGPIKQPAAGRMAEALAILAAAVRPAAAPAQVVQEAPPAAGGAGAAAPPDDGGRAARLAALVVGMVGTDPARVAPALRRESARVATAAGSMPGRIGDDYRRSAARLAEMAAEEDARAAAPLDPAAVAAELDQITAAARDRMGGRTGAELQAMTPAELARRHALLQQLPTFAEDRAAARARVAARVAASRGRVERVADVAPIPADFPALVRAAPAGAPAGVPGPSRTPTCSDIGAPPVAGRGLLAGLARGPRLAPAALAWGGRAAPRAFPGAVPAGRRSPCSDIGAPIDRESPGPGPGSQRRPSGIPSRWQAVRAPDLLRRTTRARQAPTAARIRQPRVPAWVPAVATSAHRFGAWLAPPARIRRWTAHTFPPPVATSARRAAAA